MPNVVTRRAYSLEKSSADKTQNSVRRMFGATSSYLFCLVLQLVDDQKLGGPTHAEPVNLKQCKWVKTFIHKAFCVRRSRVQNVVSVHL